MNRPVGPQLDPWYERLIEEFQRTHRHSLAGEVVIRGHERPWVQNRNAYVQYLLHPYERAAAFRQMLVFIHEIHTHGGVHRHQGGLALYVLDGRGHTVYDGERIDWQTGDLILLPIRPGGVEHQHFNADPGRPARWLAFITLTFQEFLASDMVQIKSSPDWPDESGPEPTSIERGAPVPASQRTDDVFDDGTLLDQLFLIRNADRDRAARARSCIRGSELQWETNRQGIMRWYAHPASTDASLRTLTVYQQRIPPGSRSGRQLHPGGLVHYVLSGTGHTMLDGERLDWQQGDLIALPLRIHGVDYQHFNDDPYEPVEFIAAAPNLAPVLGVDLGGRFEQLEPSPDYPGAPS